MKNKTMMMTAAAAAALVAEAKPTLVIPKELPAAVGIPCNVYFARTLDSVKPSNYAFEAISEVGSFWEDCWTWTPAAKDAGKKAQVVFNVWDDECGLVGAVTTTVSVAAAPMDRQKARPVTVAILSASCTNSLWQDQLRKRLLEAGFANYLAVGSHSGGSSSPVCEPEKHAPHDGYGGYAWGDFLTRYALTVDEIDNEQAAAEKEQLMKLFGVKLAPGNEWRKALLKSPLVRIKDNQKVVDVQAWFDKINGGKAPDYVFICLGGNGISTIRPEKIEAAVAGQMEAARKVLGILRAAAPDMKIVVTAAFGGSTLQDGWGKNYGAKTSAFIGNKNRIAYDRAIEKLIAGLGDPKIVFMTASLNVDPVNAYPHGQYANALHCGPKGGVMFGDACAAWLLGDLTSSAD